MLLGKFSLSGLIKSVFLVTFNGYWFVTAYVALILLLPFINRVLVNLSKTNFIILISVSVFFSEVAPIVGNQVFSLDKGFGDALSVYLLGAYIRQYKIKINSKILWLSSVGLYLAMLVSIVGLFQFTGSAENITRFSYGLLPYLTAATIFIFFVNLPSFTSIRINWFANSVFASYLITVNMNVSGKLWTEFFDVSKIDNLFLIILLGIIISIFLVLVTVLIDKVRIFIFNIFKVEKTAFILIDFLVAKLRMSVKKLS